MKHEEILEVASALLEDKETGAVIVGVHDGNEGMIEIVGEATGLLTLSVRICTGLLTNECKEFGKNTAMRLLELTAKESMKAIEEAAKDGE